MSSQIRPFLSRLSRYFTAYGGLAATLRSPLFLGSLFISCLSYSYWLTDQWSSLSQSIVPNLLGFSLGTYAILFSLMTSRLKRTLKAVKNEQKISYLDEINATFFHFIFVQLIAIFWAFIYRGSALYDLSEYIKKEDSFSIPVFDTLAAVGGFFGFLLLIYSMSLVVAAALAVYRLASIVDPTD